MSHAMLGFAWSQRNMAEGGHGASGCMGREKGSCSQLLNRGQAAPEAEDQKV